MFTIVEVHGLWYILDENGQKTAEATSLEAAVAETARAFFFLDVSTQIFGPYLEITPTPYENQTHFEGNPSQVQFDAAAGHKICDFCSSKEPAWNYICPDYEVERDWAEPLHGTVSQTSRGNWMACRECAFDIERGDRYNLARRSANSILKKYKGMRHFEDVYPVIRRMHGTFFRHFTGERVPYNLE